MAEGHTGRRGGIAAVMSLVFPGLGQLYAGRLVRGIVLALAFIVLAPAAWYLVITRPASPLLVVLAILIVPVLWIGSVIDAALVARTAGPERKWFQRWYVLLAVLLVAGTTRYLLVQGTVGTSGAFRVPSSAMEPTLLIGDYIYVDKRKPLHVARGDLAVHLSTEEAGLLMLKRIVALGGDTVMMRAGRLRVNGAEVPEPYLEPGDVTSTAEPGQRARMRRWQEPLTVSRDSMALHPDLNDWGPLVVPEGNAILLGDNRQASYDSRYYGPVPLDSLVGKPATIYFSHAPAGDDSENWLSTTRWSRIGRAVR